MYFIVPIKDLCPTVQGFLWELFYVGYIDLSLYSKVAFLLVVEILAFRNIAYESTLRVPYHSFLSFHHHSTSLFSLVFVLI